MSTAVPSEELLAAIKRDGLARIAVTQSKTPTALFAEVRAALILLPCTAEASAAFGLAADALTELQMRFDPNWLAVFSGESE